MEALRTCQVLTSVGRLASFTGPIHCERIDSEFKCVPIVPVWHLVLFRGRKLFGVEAGIHDLDQRLANHERLGLTLSRLLGQHSINLKCVDSWVKKGPVLTVDVQFD